MILLVSRVSKSVFCTLLNLINQISYCMIMLSLVCVTIVVSFISACDSLDFDEVDFDEPMELGADQQEEPAVKVETEPEAKPSLKVEPKTEPEDEVLM